MAIIIWIRFKSTGVLRNVSLLSGQTGWSQQL